MQRLEFGWRIAGEGRMYEKRPWLAFYGNIPGSIDYPDKTMYELVAEAGALYPSHIAYDFMGTRSTYAKLVTDIDRTADALLTHGVKKPDSVTVSLPNCPQAVILFYALNKIGARACMIHPLSAPAEIAFYIRETGSTWAVTLDAFYPRFAEILDGSGIRRILVVRIDDYLSPLKKIGFFIASGRKIKKLPADVHILQWKDFMGREPETRCEKTPLAPNECAVVLFSGGTSGAPKGILLTSANFNALALQIAPQGPLAAGDSILSILPMFHGFGLGVCIHAFLVGGGKCVLVPRFTAQTVAKLIEKERPQYMAGVPTLYESLLREKRMYRIDLSCLKTAYAGGDKLPMSIKRRFDELIADRGGSAELLEGYGLTESVTACVVTPKGSYREGSVGIPIPDVLAKIVVPGTTDEAKPGEDGELCIAGPTVMLGYAKSPEDNANTLKVHPDGITWLHTGDLCSMDSDGFVYFKLRMKRIIKVSGISVSPVQIEEVLDSHPDVALSCVIGVPDEHKITTLRAFVVLRDPAKAKTYKEMELVEHCRKHLIKWSVPESIEFRDSLPLTRVGKVAFAELEREYAEQDTNRSEGSNAEG